MVGAGGSFGTFRSEMLILYPSEDVGTQLSTRVWSYRGRSGLAKYLPLPSYVIHYNIFDGIVLSF